MNKDECSQLKEKIYSFSELWDESISKNICPKLDCLTMVIPIFLDNLEGYTGAISDQSIEHLHNVTNKEARTAINIANPADRVKYLLEVHIFINIS